LVYLLIKIQMITIRVYTAVTNIPCPESTKCENSISKVAISSVILNNLEGAKLHKSPPTLRINRKNKSCFDSLRSSNNGRQVSHQIFKYFKKDSYSKQYNILQIDNIEKLKVRACLDTFQGARFLVDKNQQQQKLSLTHDKDELHYKNLIFHKKLL
jgi:hypothetical protein